VIKTNKQTRSTWWEKRRWRKGEKECNPRKADWGWKSRLMMVENNFLDGHAMAFNTLATSGREQAGKGPGVALEGG